jgi:hypothetical protein
VIRTVNLFIVGVFAIVVGFALGRVIFPYSLCFNIVGGYMIGHFGSKLYRKISN